MIEPLLIDSTRLQSILNFMDPQSGRVFLDRFTDSVFSQVEISRRDILNGFEIQNGIAIIPVSGPLSHKGFQGGFMSYDFLGLLISEAANNPAIRGILLDVDSPGSWLE